MSIKNKVQKAVSDLYQQNGGQVKASDLVMAAKPKTSPIHDAFEWDNNKAGHEYRLWQARQWIRQVKVSVDDAPVRLVHVPIRTVGSSEGYYRPVSVIQHDEFQAAMQETVSKLEAAQVAYEELKSVQPKNGKKPHYAKADRGFRDVKEALAV